MTTIKRMLAGVAIAAAVAVPMLKPAPAHAEWRGGGGWHGGGWHGGGWHGGGWHGGWHAGWGWGPGWGWRGGVYVGLPPVVVGAPAYGYGYPYAAPYHWVPGYYAANGGWVPPHWGYY